MKGPKITLEQIEQEIDLDEFFPEIDFSEERAFKEALGQAIIDKIVSRTEAGEGIRISASGQGRPVKLKSPYSNQYADSLEFKAAGKKKTKVNMTLTGDMLASVDVLGTSGSKIRVGITDDEQIPKAFNHITGDTVPERPWFGVSKGELKEILDSFKSDVESIVRKQAGDLTDEDIEAGETEATKLRALDYFDEEFD